MWRLPDTDKSASNLAKNETHQQIHLLDQPIGISGVDIWLDRLAEASQGEDFSIVRLKSGRHLISNNGSHRQLTVAGLSRLVDRPTTIFTHYGITAYLAAANLLRLGCNYQQVRIISVVHSDEPWYYSAAVQFEGMICKYICVSQSIAARLMQLLPHRSNDIFVLVYSLLPHFETRVHDSESKTIRIAYAGRYVQKQKRILDFVTFADTLLARNVDFRLDMYGSGVDERSLRELATGSKSFKEGRLVINGRLEPKSVLEVWQQADLCLLLSEFEGTSIAMLEAMAAGAVPVVTAVSGARELIINYENGVCSNSYSELTDFIAQVGKDRTLLHRCSSAAQSLVRSQFPTETYLKKFAEIMAVAWQSDARSFCDLSADPVFDYFLSRVLPLESSVAYGFLADLARPLFRLADRIRLKRPAGK